MEEKLIGHFPELLGIREIMWACLQHRTRSALKIMSLYVPSCPLRIHQVVWTRNGSLSEISTFAGETAENECFKLLMSCSRHCLCEHTSWLKMKSEMCSSCCLGKKGDRVSMNCSNVTLYSSILNAKKAQLKLQRMSNTFGKVGYYITSELVYYISWGWYSITEVYK